MSDELLPVVSWDRTVKPQLPYTKPRLVKRTEMPEIPTKRCTFDLEIALHKRVKIGCAERSISVSDLIRELLAREFP
jgi:hypothetical protein